MHALRYRCTTCESERGARQGVISPCCQKRHDAGAHLGGEGALALAEGKVAPHLRPW